MKTLAKHTRQGGKLDVGRTMRGLLLDEWDADYEREYGRGAPERVVRSAAEFETLRRALGRAGYEK